MKYGKDLLPLIKADSKTERFSENLMKWVRKHRNVPLFVAYSLVSLDGVPLPEFSFDKTCTSNLYIGLGDLDQGYLHGARLSQIISNGVNAEEFAYTPKMKFQIIPDWWERYIECAKCCIDPEHRLYGDRERWQVSDDGKQRTCLWCGNHRQYEHTEMVPRKEWRDMPKTGDFACQK